MKESTLENITSFEDKLSGSDRFMKDFVKFMNGRITPANTAQQFSVLLLANILKELMEIKDVLKRGLKVQDVGPKKVEEKKEVASQKTTIGTASSDGSAETDKTAAPARPVQSQVVNKTMKKVLR